ncbi:Grx4 family monothiol glutaredoxin [Thioalkalivibrio sp. HK1]|uniref:Grx4 family monothiol glutaredoxin n=1 Tax=Thioalkalivibrio sp. HK1 TaxID=1469245 RepID=UPI000470D07F|nr:Grx4 family monothiol glutaredoxin [Thioalkalivibrio sp. HK1]
MPLDPSLQSRIESLIEADRVVLFMKGTRMQPMCGFSATTVSMLDSLVSDYTTFNVLEDQRIRDGIKEFSEWPTIPQLYIDREFVGGCDIVKQMFNSGELHEALGLEAPDRTPPAISISDAAADLIRRAREGNPGQAVHLSIDGRWQHAFNLAPVQGHEIRAEDKGVEILFDIASAPKAKNLAIDIEETMQGTAFKIDNPNAPPPVKQITPAELAAAMAARGEGLELVDTRTSEEREQAKIEPSTLLDRETMQSLSALPKDSYLVFYCHTGVRSQSVAEHFRAEGFVNVHNLSGGIDAWSREVDTNLPRY